MPSEQDSGWIPFTNGTYIGYCTSAPAMANMLQCFLHFEEITLQMEMHLSILIILGFISCFAACMLWRRERQERRAMEELEAHLAFSGHKLMHEGRAIAEPEAQLAVQEHKLRTMLTDNDVSSGPRPSNEVTKDELPSCVYGL